MNALVAILLCDPRGTFRLISHWGPGGFSPWRVSCCSPGDYAPPTPTEQRRRAPCAELPGGQWDHRLLATFANHPLVLPISLPCLQMELLTSYLFLQNQSLFLPKAIQIPFLPRIRKTHPAGSTWSQSRGYLQVCSRSCGRSPPCSNFPVSAPVLFWESSVGPPATHFKCVL